LNNSQLANVRDFAALSQDNAVIIRAAHRIRHRIVQDTDGS